MASTTTKARVKKSKMPSPGRKLSKRDARAYVFKTYREAMKLLAKH